MPATYDSGLLEEKDQVRFLVQDNKVTSSTTTVTNPAFQDEEIEWALGQEQNIYMAAASLCDSIVTRSGGIKSKKISDMAIVYDTSFYIRLGGRLRARGSGHQIPYCGGISIGDKLVQQMDSDAVQPAIVRNLDNNPAAPSPVVPPSNPLTTI